MTTLSARAGGGPSRRPWRSIRVRIVLVEVALLAAAMTVSVLVTRAYLFHRLDERVDRRLAAQVTELRAFAATGVDPATGRPFTTAAGLMQLAIERSVPDEYETLLSVVAGRPGARSSQAPPLRLDQDPAFVRQVADVDHVQYGWLDTRVGRVRYIAAPVTVPTASAGAAQGVYVAGWFRDLDVSDVRATTRALVTVGTVAAVVIGLLSWLFVARLLAPLRHLSLAARRVNEHDLSPRVAARATGDELADITRAFNGMLDRLESAFEEQRRFTDDASHELRTPITIVRGHLELLSVDPQVQGQQRELMLDELDRMARMVEDLLTLTRSEQPDFLRPEPFDVVAFVDELDANVRMLGDRDWQLVTDGGVAADAGSVEVDRHRVTQATLQLAQNAVQHTGDGDVVRIEARAHRHGLTITVSDTGPGVPPEQREAVFARFTRAPGTSRSGPGAGLGLAIVAAIADAHGGTVAFCDPPAGRGASVVLHLPARPVRGDAP